MNCASCAPRGYKASSIPVEPLAFQLGQALLANVQYHVITKAGEFVLRPAALQMNLKMADLREPLLQSSEELRINRQLLLLKQAGLRALPQFTTGKRVR